jgi:hypothetical protein
VESSWTVEVEVHAKRYLLPNQQQYGTKHARQYIKIGGLHGDDDAVHGIGVCAADGRALSSVTLVAEVKSVSMEPMDALRCDARWFSSFAVE